jgi:hypothetical protein
MQPRSVVPFLLAAAALLPLPLYAQRSTAPPTAADSAAAFADDGARAVFHRAREARRRTDAAIRSYTAVVKSRTAAGMRMPLKDRTLFRQETATRVRWSRDAETVVQLLAARVQHPGGVEAPRSLSGLGVDELFDPAGDRMYFGLGRNDEPDDDDDDDFWIEHPLGDAAERHYRYRSGDTLTIRLQGDRQVRVLELRVTPRRDDPHTVRGTLWIDAASGALVQAAFRLARTVDILHDIAVLDDDDRRDIGKVPGFLKPFEFDISLMTVEYSLWEMQHWLPRTMRIEGVARAGVLRFPGSADVSYEIEDVAVDDTHPEAAHPDAAHPDAAPEVQNVRTEHDSVPLSPAQALEREAARRIAAEWAGVADFDRLTDDSSTYIVRNRRQSGRRVLVLAPQDSSALLTSPQLPPPIWSDAPGFATQAEIRDLSDRLASLGGPVRRDVRGRIGWGLGEDGMVRYNRVESLSVGARGTAVLPPATVSGVLRLGVADLHPNAVIAARRESARRVVELRAYHELTTTDPNSAALGLANSLSALVLGRDAGEYYRASGVSVALSPPSLQRQSWDVALYAEYQNDVARNTHVALPRMWEDSVFRTNIRAAEAMQYGTLIRLRPWWGTDPRRAQAGVEIMAQAETGEYDLARGAITLRGALPLGARYRLGAEAGAGTSTGDVTPQRLFFLGGAQTLRGYDASTVAGTSMARARLELARTASFGALSLFGDWGWAGDRGDIVSANQRLAFGVGASLLDGLLRVDLARAVRAPRGWRVDMHLDAIL